MANAQILIRNYNYTLLAVLLPSPLPKISHLHPYGLILRQRGTWRTRRLQVLTSRKHLTQTNGVDNLQGEVVAQVEVAAPVGDSLEAFHMDLRSNNQEVVGVRIPDTLRVLLQFLLEVNNCRTGKACIQGEASVGTVGQGTVGELQREEPSAVPLG